MAYGVDETGFTIKPLAQIRADIEARQNAAPQIGPAVDKTDGSSLGQLNGTMASEIAELWELGHDVYASHDPEAAEGVPLDNIGSLSGTVRRGASATRVACDLVLDPGTLVPSGSLVSVDGRPDIQCSLEADVENAGGVQDAFPGVFVCTQLGPVAIAADTLTVIDTPVAGWVSVDNDEDGAIGHARDDETTYRERRTAGLARRGGSTVRALRADLIALDGIEAADVLENTSDVIDANGLPPHSFEALVDDGAVPALTDAEIAQVIFDGRPDGIKSFGSESAVLTDDFGNNETVYFTRMTRVDVWIEFTLTTGAGFPADGVDQVKAAMVARGNTLKNGQDVVALYIRAAAFNVSGVTDVPFFAIGLASSPTLDDNLPMDPRERATFDTTRVSEA